MSPSVTMLKCWWTPSCVGLVEVTTATMRATAMAFLEGFLRHPPYPLAPEVFPFPPDVLWVLAGVVHSSRIRRLTLEPLTALLLSMTSRLLLTLRWNYSTVCHENTRVLSPVDLLIHNHQYLSSLFLTKWEQSTVAHYFKAKKGKITWISNRKEIEVIKECEAPSTGWLATSRFGWQKWLQLFTF